MKKADEDARGKRSSGIGLCKVVYSELSPPSTWYELSPVSNANNDRNSLLSEITQER